MEIKQIEIIKTELKNKKYILLESALNGICNNILNLLILEGETGIGKSYNVTKYMEDNKIDYVLINSFITPLEFYKSLYNNRSKKIIIFDDVELSDNKTKALLKVACWGVSKARDISYNSSSSKLDVPRSFTITSNIILICNGVPKGFIPIINRGEKIDFNFSFKEKIILFESIMDSNKDKIEKQVLEYVKLNCNDSTTNLSIRTLEILTSYYKVGEDWENHAQEMLKTDEKLSLILKGVNETEFMERTGLSRATYFNYKKKLAFKDLNNPMLKVYSKESLKV